MLFIFNFNPYQKCPQNQYFKRYQKWSLKGPQNILRLLYNTCQCVCVCVHHIGVGLASLSSLGTPAPQNVKYLFLLWLWYIKRRGGKRRETCTTLCDFKNPACVVTKELKTHSAINKGNISTTAVQHLRNKTFNQNTHTSKYMFRVLLYNTAAAAAAAFVHR